MKKYNPFVWIFLVVMIMSTSCNKTWNCVCKDSSGVVAITAIKSLGKMGAKDVCDGYQEQKNANGARQVCTLK